MASSSEPAAAETASPPASSVVGAGPKSQTTHTASADADKAVVAEGVDKAFRMSRERPTTLKQRVLHPLASREFDEIVALRDVSFEIAKGEFFGVIGRNGSGKSTLLKLMAGIYRPDAGRISVEGRLSPFIELGVGFNPELTARDNVIINCTMLGLPRAEAVRRFDRILQFAELEEFVDLKLKNYSSGMHVRLAFSTAIQVDADVLLLDEVLAVGDARFQEKCFDVFRRMKSEGRTIVLVTHGLDAVERFCERAMLLDKGHLVEVGPSSEVVNRYRTMVSESMAGDSGTEWRESGRWGDGSAEIMEAWLEGPDGERLTAADQGEPVRIAFEAAFHRPMSEPVLGVLVRNERNEIVFVANTIWAGVKTGEFGPGDRARIAISLENRFGVGRYFISPAISQRDLITLADHRENFATFTVEGPRWTGAAMDLPHQIELERP
jgi:ABC-2 type transport system ATP-binding protein